MLRLRATKTSLYKLVAEYVDDLPPMRTGAKFWKAPRVPDYFLEWVTPGWDRAQAFFAACMGKPMLSVTVRDCEGHEVSRQVYDLTVEDLRERGMVERFITAAERRRIERSADNGGLSPAT